MSAGEDGKEKGERVKKRKGGLEWSHEPGVRRNATCRFEEE